jgi:hypothetical protein
MIWIEAMVGASLIGAHVALSAFLGGLWRRIKGSHGGGLIASLTFAPLCLLVTGPTLSVSVLAWLLASLGVGISSTLFLLVEANNGGDGNPARRFGWFGSEYVKYQQAPGNVKPLVLFGKTLVARGAWTEIGELGLGARWFGAMAGVADLVVALYFAAKVLF